MGADIFSIEIVENYAKSYSRFADMFYREDMKDHLKVLLDTNSSGQVISKLELLRRIQKMKRPKNPLFIGHWHGLLPLLMHNFGLIENAIGVEINSHWVDFSKKLNCSWDWNSELIDAGLLSQSFYDERAIDLIVNTSCEHMLYDWIDSVPTGVLIIAQTNNLKIPEHINLEPSLESFMCNLKLNKIIDSYEQQFLTFKRFTLVGYK